MENFKKELVFSRTEIQKRIDELALELSADYSGKDVVFLGVLKGVFMFFSDLIKAMTIPVLVDFVRLASYGNQMETSGQILLTKDLELDVRDRHVVVIEDIADSGLTLDWLVNHLEKMGAESVKVCVLINKLERRDKRVVLDYVGFEIATGFLVGYGLDYNEQYRDLTDIYHLVVD